MLIIAIVPMKSNAKTKAKTKQKKKEENKLIFMVCFIKLPES